MTCARIKHVRLLPVCIRNVPLSPDGGIWERKTIKLFFCQMTPSARGQAAGPSSPRRGFKSLWRHEGDGSLVVAGSSAVRAPVL